ncbi:hypothetical protein L211DRAFT_837348 [Terfezia boudieri ATCC MYA-4762]|uniref:Uncharacterized protein n=1 Tax=Terfezia boudieri ATCC MYA-4762 TaxID=1051890 RepID=A0A3N4M2B5_9PEZI|nr:hypothetical protein L211DRAFT_837348 [Terfezia boudieri ATCC MYA-4762]
MTADFLTWYLFALIGICVYMVIFGIAFNICSQSNDLSPRMVLNRVPKLNLGRMNSDLR